MAMLEPTFVENSGKVWVELPDTYTPLFMVFGRGLADVEVKA
jgi:hypothetical protein